jgi:maltose alpha-D-glucosyltransferase/alpha-amylase
VPVELTGGTPFPPISELPYMLTLPAYGFFWFLLAGEVDAPRWHVQAPEPLPEFVTCTIPGGQLDRALEGRERQQLERFALPEFLGRQRWFAGKSGAIRDVAITPLGSIPGEPNQLAILDVRTVEDEQRYLLPLSVIWGEQNLRSGGPKLSYTLAKVRHGANLGALVDASYDERFIADLLHAMQSVREQPAAAGTLHFDATEPFRTLEAAGEIRPVGAEQSNVSAIVGDTVMVKIYRRLRPGEQPEVEVARFLTEVAGYQNTPAYYGSVEFVPADGEPMTLAAAFAFARNQGDAWTVVLESLDRELDQFRLLPRDDGGAGPAPAPAFAFPLDIAVTLGRRTAELHAAFAARTDDPAFAAEPIRADDLGGWVDAAIDESGRAFAELERSASQLPEELRPEVARLLDGRQMVRDRLERLRHIMPSGLKTRIHGDYHLGQVLIVQDEVMVIDFEGEPQRDLIERRRKTSGLRDVAGMLRSFDYVAWSALDRLRARQGEVPAHVRERAFAWRDAATRDFLVAYWPAAARAGILPDDEAVRLELLHLFLLQKAFYEIGYEATNRPSWLSIPVRGVLDLIDRQMRGP